MRRVAIYPGCSLEGTARDYYDSIKAVFDQLGVNIDELEGWICCGASSAHSIDSEAAFQLPFHNLRLAYEQECDLLVPCALCFNRLKTAGKQALLKGHDFVKTVKVIDLLAYLSSPHMLERISQKVIVKLLGLRAVCYYGCVVQRPPAITDAKEPENPTNMDTLLKRLGVDVIQWPHKTDCCGASHAITRPKLVEVLVTKLHNKAVAFGANCIVVSCQMCQANLDMFPTGAKILPVFYFTELINLAFGLERQKKWLKRHFIDPLPLINKVERMLTS
ncbi:MAG: disulfide reductase [Deltaproteobacteria bacterium]|nr:disulfide reductase [Deltaproteobacteria bacterium]MBW2068788.1 disulfide reductase [Deltaproteobacteria bacterium]